MMTEPSPQTPLPTEAATSNPNGAPNAHNPDELKARSPQERRKSALTWAAFAFVAVVLAAKFPQSAKTLGLFILVLGVLVFVHEWGHFQFARWGGMKVNRFALGFPPFIYTRMRKGVAYSIGALPIGGMVDIAGLGSEEEMVAEVKGADLTKAPSRQIGNRHVPRGQRLFQDAPFFWRFMTLFAGPLMNFLFAIGLFIFIYSVQGVPENVSITNRLAFVTPASPADRAGLQSDDTIVSVNGKATKTTSEVAKAVENSQGKTLQIGVQREGKLVERPLTPILDYKPALKNGRIVDQKGYMIGVQFAEHVGNYRHIGVQEAIATGMEQSLRTSQGILDILKRAVTGQLTRTETREIGGPVRIAQVVGHVSQGGWQDTGIMMARLSVNLGLMNLLPLPALDGGRLLFVVFGALHKLVLRRPLDPRKETLVHLAGMMLLLAFMLLITARDIWPYIQRNLAS